MLDLNCCENQIPFLLKPCCFFFLSEHFKKENDYYSYLSWFKVFLTVVAPTVFIIFVIVGLGFVAIVCIDYVASVSLMSCCSRVYDAVSDSLWVMNLRTSETMDSGAYPERPGEPDCSYYIRTGLCRFGATCRFNHPPNRKLVHVRMHLFLKLCCNFIIWV